MFGGPSVLPPDGREAAYIRRLFHAALTGLADCQ
jgi:hypothetical protein